MNFADFSLKCQSLFSNPNPIKLELHNHRIPSKGWKVSELSDELLESPSGDVWEVIGGDEAGEQLFTHKAAKREAKKAGKRIPTDEEWSELVKTKADIPNLVFVGFRDLAGGFHYRGTHTAEWSSSQSSASNAWRRTLYSGSATVNRNTNYKARGFSLRLLDSSDSPKKIDIIEKEVERAYKELEDGRFLKTVLRKYFTKIHREQKKKCEECKFR